ncbi:uncharacterized protein C8A04DRAFT_32470 [Dichotomopilus funicola]|uniref:Uncharacterized protein n=1 Tax=Dichotomopilus funicola TaxID=1934379 RepID=A0AAN6UVM9_9PEZI|nr:hypothetical protein C8A04DRAFT_32470 [Dichotomopilus funicola]
MPSGLPNKSGSEAELSAAEKSEKTPEFAVFENLDLEFNTDLETVSPGPGKRLLLTTKEGVQKKYLPGQPRFRFDREQPVIGNQKLDLPTYLVDNHNTRDLDGLMKFMKVLFVQTPYWKHINPLHHQASHARAIKVTENPGLHLVWYYELMYIKPIPAYFYSKAFWDYLKDHDKGARDEDKILGACLGFMRTYYMLIQYENDYREACKLHIIPPKSDGSTPTYEEWCNFILPFAKVLDKETNRRYHYGELRLSRINRVAFFCKFSLAYFHIYPQWGSFLEHTLTPVITIFAIFSTVLNSMQVGLAALDSKGQKDQPPGLWGQFVEVSIWFPVVVMASIALVLLLATAGMATMGIKDYLRGRKVRAAKKAGQPVDPKSHGMIR